MSNSLAGFDTKLYIKIDSTYTEIPELSQIEHGDFSVSFRNPNTLASRTVVKRPTLVNLGKVSATVFYLPNNSVHQELRDDVLSPPSSPREFRLEYADGMAVPAHVDFKGFVAAFPVSGIEVEGTVESKFEIEVTDDVDFVEGSAGGGGGGGGGG